ncbi:MAG: thermonuclease family protein, partial [Clostridia bacterium]|nr:thermonuclease family protein [Clostridia bacterium]
MKTVIKRLLPLLLAVLTAVSLTGCKFNIDYNIEVSTEKNEKTEESLNLNGPYDVIRVVDGDTIIIDLNGEKTKVRLSNVDTPESVAGEESGKENTPEGIVASDYIKKLLPDGSKVYLEYDNKIKDKYDRVLAYVYLEDGETMIQRLLLKDGMAKVFNDKQNKRYTD